MNGGQISCIMILFIAVYLLHIPFRCNIKCHVEDRCRRKGADAALALSYVALLDDLEHRSLHIGMCCLEDSLKGLPVCKSGLYQRCGLRLYPR